MTSPRFEIVTQDRYDAAVQHPESAFEDDALLRMHVARSTSTPWLFDVTHGGFAAVYRMLEDGGKAHALRCFHRLPTDVVARYAHISRQLNAHAQWRFIVGTRAIERGIRIRWPDDQFAWRPVTTMDWVQGRTLDSHLRSLAKINDPAWRATIRQLLLALEETVEQLASAGVAHGDLQPQNIIVSSDSELTLIDYDGMYVPGMTAFAGHEAGHADWQHPARDGSDFGPIMDRFSSIALWVTLKAFEADRELIQTSDGDHLLFRRIDFDRPDVSPVFAQLGAVASLAEHSANLQRICSAPLELVPSLEDFLAGRRIPFPSDAVPRPPPDATQRARGSLLARAQFVTSVPKVIGRVLPAKGSAAVPTIPASSRLDLLLREGQTVRIVGRIARIGRPMNAAPGSLITIETGGSEPIKVYLDSSIAARFPRGGVDMGLSPGDWIAVVGRPHRLAGAIALDAGSAESIELLDPAQVAIELDQKRAPGPGVPAAGPRPPAAHGTAQPNRGASRVSERGISSPKPDRTRAPGKPEPLNAATQQAAISRSVGLIVPVRGVIVRLARRLDSPSGTKYVVTLDGEGIEVHLGPRVANALRVSARLTDYAVGSQIVATGRVTVEERTTVITLAQASDLVLVDPAAPVTSAAPQTQVRPPSEKRMPGGAQATTRADRHLARVPTIGGDSRHAGANLNPPPHEPVDPAEGAAGPSPHTEDRAKVLNSIYGFAKRIVGRREDDT